MDIKWFKAVNIYLHECNTFTCIIKHGMMTIPFTMAPVHLMQDGDSFTVASHTRETGGGASSSSRPPHIAADGSDDVAANPESSEEEPGDSDDPAMQTDRSDSTSLQGVHIFRLGHHQVFNRLRWDTADHILQDAARSVRVPPAQCVCFHYMQVSPDDHDVQQEAIILQHVTDIAPGSTEKLILVDIELHAAGVSISSILQAPRILRQVHKVVPVLTRSQLLHIARVSAYCEWMGQGCFVFCNRAPWTLQDQGPKRIMHGMYFRITVPPPPDSSWELAHTLRVFEETAELFDKPDALRLAAETMYRTYAQPDVSAQRTQEAVNDSCQCKGADLGAYDIDVPITNPPRAYQRRLRPEHDGSLQWLLDLGQIFSEQAQEEAFVDEPMLYIQTWFVNHLHHPSCRQPRPLRLERYSITWIDDFRQLWRDVLQRNEIFSLRVVRPNPPQPRSWNYACHVIVEQSVQDHRAACLLTALMEGARMDAIHQGAFSLPRIIRRQNIIDAMEIEPFCEGRICTATWGDVPIHLVDATEIISGCSIRIRVRPSQSQVPIVPGTQESHFDDMVLFQTTFDALSLMQTHVSSSTRQQGTDLPVHDGECHAFALDPHAPEFQPGAWNIAAQPEHIQDLYRQWAQRAFSWAGEAASSNVITWFVDHRHFIHCYAGRAVTLYEDFGSWEQIIRRTWQDLIDPNAPLEFNTVTPVPPRLEPYVAAHVILVQAPREDWVTSLVSVFDRGIYGPEPRRAAITTHEHIRIEHLLAACNYDPVCLNYQSQVQCQAWYDQMQLLPGNLLPGRSGYGIMVHVQRLPVPVYTPPAVPEHEGQVLLQIKAMTKSKTILCLDECISDDLPSLVPVTLIDDNRETDFPTQLFLPDPVSEHAIEQELAKMGWQRHVYHLRGTGFAFCVACTWSLPPEQSCFIYFSPGNCDRDSVILHLEKTHEDVNRHMQVLHSLGFCRAVIVDSAVVRPGLALIEYHNNEPALEAQSSKNRKATPWPPQMPAVSPQPFFAFPDHKDDPPVHCLDLGIDFDTLKEFFTTGDDVLCQWHSHLDLPAITLEEIDRRSTSEIGSYQLAEFDRLVIYTDGSSKTQNRRKPPLWIQECDVPDAWAFLVLGERYTNDVSKPEIVLIGWHAQCVTYEDQLTHFLGTTQVGSEHAEREALFWAALWRLSRNISVPTIFRSDSVTTAEQAMGRAGCNDCSTTFGALRSVFQALQAALPPECIDAQHVRGHAGDPWNEMVDFLAKSEAIKSRNLKRQQVNLQKWKNVLPYLWMLFDKSAGLPTFTGQGFDVCPPQAPKFDPPNKRNSPTTKVARHHMTISLATCNVSSLYAGPEGFGGKLGYLRQQMCDLQLNFLGIQEARSTAGAFQTADVIRLASGGMKGQHGVELWINTKQPIAHKANKPCFLQMTHLQVIHSDHRRLIVRLAHPCLDCHLCVLHAPQSGRPLSERRTWWEETHHIFKQFLGEVSVYVFMDANAKTGPCCEPIVFAHDDTRSANTDFMIEYLKTFGLCLPSTTDLHQGSHSTWTAPDGLTQHRIDYIAIPQNELCFCTQSCSIDCFDAGNGHEDHQAVGVQLQWIQDRKIRLSHGLQRGRFDRDAIMTQANVIDLAAVQTCAWTEDIETQVQSLNQAIHCTLQTACPRHKQSKKKQYLSSDLWDYRTAKLHLRRRLQNARRQHSLDSVRLVFWAWKHRNDESDSIAVALCNHAAHTNTVLCSIFHLNCKYYRLTRIMRRELMHSKSRHLSQVLAQTNEATSAGMLLQTLKPFIGPTNLKKQKKKGLPAVRKRDGSVCTTPEEAQDRWIEFFSHLEGGQRMDHETYRNVWRQNLAKFLVSMPFSIPITDLPTLAELEAAYRRVPPGKAVGNDGIPPEICHVKPRDLARLTYAILIKTFVYGQEAIEHKGGRLAIAWKHRGDVRDCDTHRSLLVSSHMGKTIHRALRQKHHGLYTTYMQGQQLGGRPKIPVGIPLHLSRAFMRWQDRLQRPTACIFLDLAEAFYRLI